MTSAISDAATWMAAVSARGYSNQRCEANTASGSTPEILSTATQLKRQTPHSGMTTPPFLGIASKVPLSMRRCAMTASGGV